MKDHSVHTVDDIVAFTKPKNNLPHFVGQQKLEHLEQGLVNGTDLESWPLI